MASTRAQRAAELAERRAEMWRLRVTGWTQQQIADNYGISQQSVSEQLRKAYVERPATAIDEYRLVELDKLDRAERVVIAVMTRRHVTVSGGKIISTVNEHGEEEPLLDDAPVLAAVDRLVKIAQHRADLLGLKAPTRVSIEAENLSAEISALLAAALADSDDDDDA